MVGYLDRFEGMMEVDLSLWENRDPTEETFIPWHRVQYFKQNGEIVWDRRTREDYIFGPPRQLEEN